jgi:hypothetical protein
VTSTEVTGKNGVCSDGNNIVRLPADRKLGVDLLRQYGDASDGLESIDVAAQGEEQDAVHGAF